MVEWSYEHNEGVIPATKLKGVPIINTHGDIYWVARFYYAVPLLDIALTNRNILQVSINNSVFPFRVMMASECDFSDNESRCVNGNLESTTTSETLGRCTRCNGSGKGIPPSPLGVYLWEQGNAIDGANTIPYKPVEYISPDNDPLIFVREQVEIDTDKARSILHLSRSNSQVKGSENMTATGMVLDQKAQHAFVKMESDQLFDLYDFTLQRMSWQRYDSYEPAPEVVYPSNFDFTTEADLWAEIKLARDAEAPPLMIQELFYKLLVHQNASNPDAMKVFDTVIASDILFALSEKEIALRKAAGTIEDWRITLHNSSLQLVDELRMDNENWLDLELSERIAGLEELAKSVTLVPPNNVIDNIITGNGI
jgi:hypothetical protein